MALSFVKGFSLVTKCILIYEFVIVLTNGIGVASSDSSVSDTLYGDIRDQIETIANTTAGDILHRLSKDIDKLEAETVQELVFNQIQGVIRNVTTETTKLTKDLRTEINKLIKTKEDQILNKTKDELDILSNNCQTDYSNFKVLINTKVDNASQLIKEDIDRDIQSIKVDLEKALYDISQYTPPSMNPQGAIAFTAMLSRNFHNSGNSFVKFDHILTNLGSGYDADSGIFTARTNGSYVFSASFLVNGGYVNVQLLKNNAVVVRGYGAKDVVEGSGFVYSILELIKDDKIGLQMVQNWSTGYLRGDMYSSFSGFFVGS